MKFTVTTENGSVYLVDDKANTWEQVKWTSFSGVHRSDRGDIIDIIQMRLGEPMIIRDTNVRDGFTHHFLQTSLVKKIEFEASELD